MPKMRYLKPYYTHQNTPSLHSIRDTNNPTKHPHNTNIYTIYIPLVRYTQVSNYDPNRLHLRHLK